MYFSVGADAPQTFEAKCKSEGGTITAKGCQYKNGVVVDQQGNISQAPATQTSTGCPPCECPTAKATWWKDVLLGTITAATGAVAAYFVMKNVK